MKPVLVAILALSTMLPLTACGDESADPAKQDHAALPPPAASGREMIDCAVGGAAGFQRVCTVDQVPTPDGMTLVLRAPDGGFRRLQVTADGRGVVAADGAEPAQVAPVDAGHIEVAIGRDRYRLPASIKSPG
jgi:hypothetical protein